jgi:polar amino acid transport system substrate-binding protein
MVQGHTSCVASAGPMKISGLCFVLLTLCSNLANAACSRPILVAVNPQGLGIMIDKDENVSGINHEILQEVARLSGCQFDYVPLPRLRGFSMFEAGQIDVILSVVQTPQRDLVGEFIPLLRARASLISLKKRGPAPKLALEKGELIVRVVRGFDYGPAYQTILSKLRGRGVLEDVTDVDTVARMMRMDRVDATIMNAAVFALAAMENQLDDLLDVTLLDDLPSTDAGFYLSKKSLKKADLKTIKDSLLRVANSGQIWDVYKKNSPAWALVGLQPIVSGK